MSTKTIEKTTELVDTILKEPKLYNVIIHNDDQTPFDFVIDLLIREYRKSPQDAILLANKVHNTSKGIAGTYLYEIAETKAQRSIKMARASGYPLMFTIEQAD